MKNTLREAASFSALLLVALVSGCAWDDALDSYCRDTGRCDAGTVLGGGGGSVETGGGGGSVSTGGGGSSVETGGGGGSVSTGGGGSSVSTGGGGGSIVTGGGGGSISTGGGGGSVSTGGGGGMSTGGGSALDAGILAGANQGDGGVLPGCAMNRFFPGGTFDAIAGECTIQSMQALKPVGGADLNCTQPIDVFSVPEGMEVFGDSSCGSPPRVSALQSVRAMSFGSFRWFVSVTSGGFTISSPVLTSLFKANLAGSGRVIPAGVCSPVVLSATRVGGTPAPAAEETAVSVSVANGTRCGTAPRFAASAATVTVDVKPNPGASMVTLTASGPLFENELTLSFPVCIDTGNACSLSSQCCTGNCAADLCRP